MKNVYIGKTSITGKGIAICMVIDSDIATGNAIIYNRETDQIETITLAENTHFGRTSKDLLKTLKANTKRKLKEH